MLKIQLVSVSVMLLFSAGASSAQSVSPMLQHHLFMPFLNPAAVPAASNDRLTGVLVHRSYFSQVLRNPQHYFAGGQWRTRPINSAGNRGLAFNAHFSKSVFDPAQYTNAQVGGAIHFASDKGLLFGGGIQYGLGRWNIAPPPNLRPWDLGDPILESDLAPKNNSHLTIGIYGQYRWKLSASKNKEKDRFIGLYTGFSLPYIGLCKSGNCYVFPTETTTFFIDRPNQWGIFVRSLQQGVYYQIDNIVHRLHLVYRKDARTKALWSANASVQFTPSENSPIKFDLGLAYNNAKVWQLQASCFYALGDLNIRLYFGFQYSSTQLSMTSAADFMLAGVLKRAGILGDNQ